MLARLLMGAALACTATPVFSATETSNPELETMVVSASRTPLSITESGSSITLITRDQIERRQAVFVVDMLRDVPGLAISRAGGPGSQTQVRVRGAEANHVLVLIDGVRANDPALGDEFRFEYLTTSDVERIEVIRGPQSALWGSEAVAGVINIITGPGRVSDNFGMLAEVGENSSTRIQAHGGLSRKTFSAHGSVSRIETDGTNISRTGNEDDGFENTTVSGGVTFQPGERSSIEISGRWVDSDKDFDTIDFGTGLPADADLTEEATQAQLNARGNLSTLDGRWTHTLGITYLQTDNETFSAGTSNGSSDADRTRVYYQTSYALGSSQTPPHHVTLALEYETTDFQQRGEAFFFGDPNQDQEIDTTSAVLEYRGWIGDAFSYSLSGRHDDHSDFDDATTGRAVAAYALSARTRLRGSVGTGRKAPTFTERFGFFADVFIGNPDLEPERSFAWDIGIEQRWLDGRVRVQVSYFDQDLKDEINGFVFDPDSGLFTAENLPGTSERDGVELSWAASFGNLELAGSYTYTNSTEDRDGATTDEIRRPEHVASANINYVMLDERLNLNLNISYTGEQDDIFFPPFPEPSDVVTLDDFALVDFAAQYRINDRIALFGRATNLFDESYEEILGFRTMGRAVYVGARFELSQ